MPMVVVVGGSLSCPHKGTIPLASGSARCEVAGAQAIVSGMEAGLTVAGCIFTTPAGTASPCATTQPAVAGVSTVLTVGEMGVITDQATGPVVNTGGGPFMWTVTAAGQSAVEVSS